MTTDSNGGTQSRALMYAVLHDMTKLAPLCDEVVDLRARLDLIRSAAGTTPLVSLPWLLRQVDMEIDRGT